MNSFEEQTKRSKAWIGDAVLALFAREWILNQTNIAPDERSSTFIAMTSNDFLSSLGEPTQMEADIGVVYENEGLESAFAYIEERFLPVFKKQRANRRNPQTNARKRRKV